MMNLKPARLEARLRNNVLWHLIFDNFKSVTAFCAAAGLSPGPVGELLNLKRAPIDRHIQYKVQWRKDAQGIADYFKMPIEDVFPERLYGLQKTKIAVEIPISALSAKERQALLAPPQSDDSSVRDALASVLKTIPPREADIIRRRFGMDEYSKQTLQEISEIYGVGKERIRQLEAKGLRRLRHPKRSRKLLKYLGSAT